MQRTLSLPEIALIGGTRAALGVGVGLLLAQRLSSEQRRAVGLVLLAVGFLTTIPIAIQLAHETSGDGEDPEGFRALPDEVVRATQA